MSKVALAFALGLLFVFTYLLGVKPGYTLAYALILLFALAWLWPRYTARRISLSRHLDPGVPTAGDRRGARLRDGRQLRPHPLGSLGSPQPAHVQDFRAAADHRHLDPSRPRPQGARRPGRGVHRRIRGEPRRLHHRAGDGSRP